MRTIEASEFKARCPALLDNLDRDGILITKNGRPLARLIPAESGCASLIGSMRGKIEIRGDVFSTGHSWRAES